MPEFKRSLCLIVHWRRYLSEVERPNIIIVCAQKVTATSLFARSQDAWFIFSITDESRLAKHYIELVQTHKWFDFINNHLVL